MSVESLNPFEGANFYVNPEYVERVRRSREIAPPDIQPLLRQIETVSTTVWFDRIVAVNGTDGGMGLRGHLDEALRQQGAEPDLPLVITILLYDLPNRDCAAFASNGELRLEDDGLRRYKEEFIDAFFDIIASNPDYRRLRIVAIVEPDSLPNLVTNLESHAACRDAAEAYREGIAYAVNTLASLPNVFIYLDIGHSGWLGWEHTDNAARLYREVLETTERGMASIRGFATNVSNYSPLREQLDPYENTDEHMDVIEQFYEWNRMIDELTFVATLRDVFPNKSFIIDTGRNGWRPRGPNEPIDRRAHRNNWCNVSGAGLGERPRANPAPGVDAYVWIKPPGESDGTSDEATPNADDLRFDMMCGAEPVERFNGQLLPTDALPDAPQAGLWFHEQLLMLVRNATPPL